MGSSPLTPAAQDGRRSVRVGSLKARLTATVLLAAVVTLAVGAFGVQRMSVLSAKAADVYTDGSAPLNDLLAVQSSYFQFATWDSRTLLPHLAPAVIAQSDQFRAAARTQLDTWTARASHSALTPAAARDFAAYQENAKVHFATLDAAEAGLARGDGSSLARRVPLLTSSEAALSSSLDRAVADQRVEALRTASDARAAYLHARALTIGIVVAGVLLSVVLAWLVVQSVTRPVRRIGAVLERIAAGDLRARVDGVGDDELGQVGTSLNRTMEAISAVLRTVSRAAGGLDASSRELSATASELAASARTATARADAVSASVAEVSASVQTVSDGSGQMEQAIAEIARSTSDAVGVAGRAVEVAQTTTRRVGKLGDSSQEIASVVKLITSIAEQTNLLALNATIEAARAGEAGEGFAVVATEVKELAQETARATEDIANRVLAIQNDTSGAVEAISEISEIIGQVNDFQSTIAAAVEEQTATTNEMNRNVADAADGSRAIATGVAVLASETQRTSAQVARTESAADQLAAMSRDLQQAVAQFQL